jgi:hypothetical protein
MRATHLFVVAFLMWLAATSVWLTTKAEAKTFDPVAEWSSSRNTAAGTWQYGTETTIGGPLTLFSKHGSQAATPSYEWWSYDGTLNGPVIAFNSSGGKITIPGGPGDPDDIIWPAGELLFAPGGKLGTPANGVLRWIAPASGFYDIAGHFADLQGATVSMFILDGNSTLFSSGYGLPGHQPDVPFAVSNIQLSQGEAIDFLVNSGIDDGNDVLGISATITPSVPEPAALPILALGVMSLSRRRRRTARSLSAPH